MYKTVLKRLVVTLLLCVCFFPIFSFANEREVSVTYNSEIVYFPDVKPFIDSETQRTMVPIRFISESVGGSVGWDKESESISIGLNDKNILLPINQHQATINGKQIELDAPAQVINDRTMVSLRFVSEALDLHVDWNQETYIVKIERKVDKLPEDEQTVPNDAVQFTGKGVRVAVLDTGIAQHADLEVFDGKDFTWTTGLSSDDNGHGTIVAGIIAGKKHGIAPDVELYSLKVLDSNNRGYGNWMANAVEWSIAHNIDIINMSIMMDSEDYMLNQAIRKAINHGIIVIACAGNTGGNVTNPASLEGVISVGALNADLKTRAYYSSYIGNVDYMAQGTNVLSLNRYGVYDSTWSGTSFSAPYVTGMFALYKEAFPDKTAEELKEIVLTNATTIETNSAWKMPQKPQYDNKVVSSKINNL